MVWKTPVESPPVIEPQVPPPSRNPEMRVATLGPSIVIKGTLSGQEDLLIEGRVEGEISLRQHSVTVGEKGRVKADIFSQSICIEGEVQGNLNGDDHVTIRRTGKVRGNVTAPRVSLEDGAKFKGAIDMQPSSGKPGTMARERRNEKVKKTSAAAVDHDPVEEVAAARPRAGV
jgi:cytoskeletal protein CcmA (bactofilin family)